MMLGDISLDLVLGVAPGRILFLLGVLCAVLCLGLQSAIQVAAPPHWGWGPQGPCHMALAGMVLAMPLPFISLCPPDSLASSLQKIL